MFKERSLRTSQLMEYPKVRRILFPFGEPEPIAKYFADDNMVLSHTLSILSGSFPPGEDSFIRSVRRFSDEINDPKLKKRISGFIGQEAVHGQQHDSLNENLKQFRYPFVYIFDIRGKARERAVIRIERLVPRKAHLAGTAAAEHYTATLARRMLSSPDVQELMLKHADPQVANLLHWHAFEELEHKSVAFDVYRTVGGAEWLRIGVMFLLFTSAIPMAAAALLISLAADPQAWRPLRLIREARKTFKIFLGDGTILELAQYMRPGFHPDDIDTTGLLEEWKIELFGNKGDLAQYVK